MILSERPHQVVLWDPPRFHLILKELHKHRCARDAAAAAAYAGFNRGNSASGAMCIMRLVSTRHTSVKLGSRARNSCTSHFSSRSIWMDTHTCAMAKMRFLWVTDGCRSENQGPPVWFAWLKREISDFNFVKSFYRPVYEDWNTADEDTCRWKCIFYECLWLKQS